MSHAELVGPPGAGKSTIHSRLVEADGCFGGDVEDTIRRRIPREARGRCRVTYRSLLKDVRSFVERKFVEPGFRRAAFGRFVLKHPRFLDILSVVLRSTQYESKWLCWYHKKLAEAYQLAISTTRGGERLCLDEGFAQCAVATLLRETNESFSLDTYLEAVPIPDLLIHVTAPIDVCLDRQHERNPENPWASIEWKHGDQYEVQREVHGVCRRIVDQFADRTTVVTVENTGSIESTLPVVYSALRVRLNT